MTKRNRLPGFALSCLILAVECGCGANADPTPTTSAQLPALPGKSVSRRDRARKYLIDRQASDGSWRSETYGAFKDGGSLTPLIVQALLSSGSSDDPSIRRGIAYLESLVRPDGSIDAGPHGMSYPVYTASLAVVVLSKQNTPSFRRARDAWLNDLRRRQLTESLGWQPSDRPYGGWGFYNGIPRKPEAHVPLPPLLESNLSATVFALDALKAAGISSSEPAYGQALRFLERCQNFAGNRGTSRSLDDGGFFFIYDDPVRNKAGAATGAPGDPPRFRSYGSTTADGLRGLIACGLPVADPRVQAALNWLEKNFSPDTHPGSYPPERESVRASVYYYYARSLSLALVSAHLLEWPAPSGSVKWQEEIAKALYHRQRPDGSWANPIVNVREDDPLVATAMALEALSVLEK